MKRSHIAIAIVVSGIAACKVDAPEFTPALVIPAKYEYDSATYAARTTQEENLITALENLDDEMSRGKDSTQTLSYGTLRNLFYAGAPSLFDITTTQIATQIEKTGGWLDETAKASGKSWKPGTGGDGGVYVNRLLDEHGLEYWEMIEKCIYNASMYNQVNFLLGGDLKLSTTDRIIALYGAYPTFVNSSNATLHVHPDAFMAAYAARRDKNNGTGLYAAIKYNIIKLQAVIKAEKGGTLYPTEKADAIAGIRSNWEKAGMATCINYLHNTISTLSNTTLTDTDKANALHSLSEAIGFVYSWQGTDMRYRKITDAQIAELLTLFNCQAPGNEMAYLFVTDTFNQLPKLTQAISKLKSIYGFSSQDIEDFKTNWVAAQNR